MWHNVINYRTPHFVYTESIFNYKQIPLQKFALIEIPSITHKNYLPKNTLKRRKNPSPIFSAKL